MHEKNATVSQRSCILNEIPVGSNSMVFLDAHQTVLIAESAAHWHGGRVALRMVTRICPRFLA